jgi:glycosyltransferase involved in cell wall biosynthesis
MTGEGISLLVPFRADDEQRAETWDWLRRYYAHELPGAEIVVGSDDGVPFSKSCAVNDAASRATGDVYVILDADCYLPSSAFLPYAQQVRQTDRRRWFMPYLAMWRIRRPESERVLASDPSKPYRIASPPPASIVQGGTEARRYAYKARRYGALVQLMPAEAFWEVGGWDERFRGWGQEDGAFAKALDTLWAPRSYDGHHHAMHLWHARIGEGGGRTTRRWVGQDEPLTNARLAEEYHAANGHFDWMKRLVAAGKSE